MQMNMHTKDHASSQDEMCLSKSSVLISLKYDLMWPVVQYASESRQSRDLTAASKR
jgi:hypothetical protein